MNYLYIRAGMIANEIEKIYANSLRERKKIENQLSRLPQRKKVRILANAYKNLEKMANCKIDYQLTKQVHQVPYQKSIGMQDLINILQNGRRDMQARPFIERFKKKVKVEFPHPKEMNKLNFSTIKKNIEDEMDSEFASLMTTNGLRLAKLKYRIGIPLVRSGEMIKNIRWRLVENAN